MTSTWLIFMVIVSSIVAGILANVVASLLEKAFGQHPAIRHLSHKQLLFIVFILFLVCSVPSIYIQFSDTSKEINSINSNSSNNVNPMSTSIWPTDVVPTSTSATNIETASIEQFNSAQFFDNDLIVSIGDIWWGPTKINFVVGSPGYPNQVIEQVDVGYATIYEGWQSYEIRVVGVDKEVFDYTVHIQVTKLN